MGRKAMYIIQLPLCGERVHDVADVMAEWGRERGVPQGKPQMMSKIERIEVDVAPREGGSSQRTKGIVRFQMTLRKGDRDESRCLVIATGLQDYRI